MELLVAGHGGTLDGKNREETQGTDPLCEHIIDSHFRFLFFSDNSFGLSDLSFSSTQRRRSEEAGCGRILWLESMNRTFNWNLTLPPNTKYLQSIPNQIVGTSFVPILIPEYPEQLSWPEFLRFGTDRPRSRPTI